VQPASQNRSYPQRTGSQHSQRAWFGNRLFQINGNNQRVHVRAIVTAIDAAIARSIPVQVYARRNVRVTVQLKDDSPDIHVRLPWEEQKFIKRKYVPTQAGVEYASDGHAGIVAGSACYEIAPIALVHGI
jgi:hypothetical protein